MRIEFRQGDVLNVISLTKTINSKIAEPTEKIVQTYHYSREQFDNAQGKTSMKEFFGKDSKVCMDCPFSTNNGAKLSACYTHKINQYSGFLSQLRSIGRKYKNFDDIPEIDANIMLQIVGLSENRYVRFGTYGEPSLLPEKLISLMCLASRSWTGYTHQWRKNESLSQWFMASTHTLEEERIASLIGYRSFVASETQIESLISCPASAEMGYKSNCSKCGLCSGTSGKGKKSVVILKH